jgi:diguanylate cyclase (GGDEF)-like protein
MTMPKDGAMQKDSVLLPKDTALPKDSVLQKETVLQKDGTVQKNHFFDQHYEDYFIHPSIRQDADLRYRARILVFTILTFLLATVGMLIAQVFITAFAGYRTATLLICLSSIITQPYALYRLKKDGSYALGCLLAITPTFVNIALASVIAGGPTHSVSMQLLVVPCVAGYFFGGLRWGVVMSVLAFIFILAIYAAALSGFVFPQLIPENMAANVKYNAFMFNFGIIAALALVYETTSEAVKKERDEEHAKLTVMAQTDSLTGLPNRRIFSETLAARIALYSKMPIPRCFVLCYLDLDRFKPINDQFGHLVGDEVLKVVSERLSSALRGADFICRHGGDEFLLLLDEVSDPRAIAAIAERFLHLLQEPIATEVGLVSVGCSIGFAVYPDHFRDMAALEKAADAAMYEAKHNRLGWRMFSPAQAARG